MTYRVEVTESAFEVIQRHARYIAVDCQSPLNAQKWLQKGFDEIEKLEHMPARHNLAPESDFKTYEVRRAIVGNHFILFTVDEALFKVWVIGFRHGSQLPRPNELPDKSPPQT